MKERVTLFFLIICAVGLLKAQSWVDGQIDKGLLLVRKDSFNVVDQTGRKVGSMVIEGRLLDEQYTWTDISKLDGILSESTTYTFDKNTLNLKTSTIDFFQGKTRILGDLQWNKEHITGTYQIFQGDKLRKIKIDTTHSRLIDRAEVFAFIHAFPLRVGLRLPVNVFVQPSGEIWNMTVEVIAEEKCIVPAGVFDTFKIDFSGGKISNVLYVSKEPYPKLVKVNVTGQPLFLELVSSRTK